jgi:hypothetical protein
LLVFLKTTSSFKETDMRNLIWLLLLLPVDVFAKAPECPLYENKMKCLSSVEDNYKNFLDFINEEDEDKDKLIQAAVDIKHYETLACQKTCVN